LTKKSEKVSTAQGVGLEEPDYHGGSEDTVSRSESVPKRAAAGDDHLSQTEGEDKGTADLGWNSKATAEPW
jgi:hypothetical protein